MTDIPTAPRPAGHVMIRLDRVSKHYPGQPAPAVSELSLDVRTGEIVVLLGPSGCGKTTTLRLINRLIEPTSGAIFLDGEDVTRVNPDQLRRRIGYVIQQIGLFPHLTIADNIGLIPKTLGWDRGRIRTRVDELLDLVGLDPAGYRRRYPKQLSGGQQQRIGVARALAADPPVMLMDEPFGAIDPITRERLQDEFLGLQGRIGKTIVLVTHDVAEAIKLGDRIAIFADGARLAQYDSPAAILADPADAFVASFIGTGAAVRRLGLRRVDTLPLDPVDLTRPSDRAGRDRTGPARRVLLVDDAGHPQRWLHPASTHRALGVVGPDVAVVRIGDTLHDVLDAMLRAGDDAAVVVDDGGQVLGMLPWSTVVREHQHQGGPELPVTGGEPVRATGRPS